eukprot:gnl/Chilomastix_cuspidata/5317.p1 GENE.gnl/Chilomastix_cuspidata/5317~~gnl/Chilomastix_cuspidata/5317.p1  ORF type:complete len:1903 (+),score=502.82 gnl/Chilomastix_cuspidata/5317:70-5778(+)
MCDSASSASEGMRSDDPDDVEEISSSSSLTELDSPRGGNAIDQIAHHCLKRQLTGNFDEKNDAYICDFVSNTDSLSEEEQEKTAEFLKDGPPTIYPTIVAVKRDKPVPRNLVIPVRRSMRPYNCDRAPGYAFSSSFRAYNEITKRFVYKEEPASSPMPPEDPQTASQTSIRPSSPVPIPSTQGNGPRASAKAPEPQRPLPPRGPGASPLSSPSAPADGAPAAKPTVAPEPKKVLLAPCGVKYRPECQKCGKPVATEPLKCSLCENVFHGAHLPRSVLEEIPRELQGRFFCPACQACRCCMCGGTGDCFVCSNCEFAYHAECHNPPLALADIRRAKKGGWTCRACRFDGGYMEIDKIFAARLASDSELQKEKFRQQKSFPNVALASAVQKALDEQELVDSWDTAKFSDKRLFEILRTSKKNKTKISRNPLRLPKLVSDLDRLYFLVKPKRRSALRSVWVPYRRLQHLISPITRRRLPTSVEEFLQLQAEQGAGPTGHVTLYKQTETGSSVSASTPSSRPASPTDDKESDLDDPEPDALLDEEEIPDEHLLSTVSDLSEASQMVAPMATDFLSRKYLKLFNSMLQISSRLKESNMTMLAKLFSFGIPRSMLEPEAILARYKSTFLVKWRGLPYKEATWEHRTRALPLLETSIRNFLIDSMSLRHFPSHAISHLPLRNKDYISREPPIHGPLGVFRKLTKTPPYINHRLFSYQLDAVNWLLYSHAKEQNVILADEMGLGKTIEVISFLSSLAEQGVFGPFLIVVPLSTLDNWLLEIKRWSPVLNCVVHDTSVEFKESLYLMLRGGYMQRVRARNEPRYRVYTQRGNARKMQVQQKKKIGKKAYSLQASREAFRKKRPMPLFPTEKADAGARFPTVVLSTYSRVISDHSTLVGLAPFAALIVDEGHRLKSGRQSVLTRRLQEIHSTYRILLTGTPIQNNIIELANLLTFLEPVKFRNTVKVEKLAYESSYGTGTQDEKSRTAALVELQRLIAPHMLFRKQTDVLKNIPKRVELSLPVDLSPYQKALYAAILRENSHTLTQTIRRQVGLGRTLMNLRKLCNHPILLKKDYKSRLQDLDIEFLISTSSKMLLLDRLLTALLKGSHKILIFSQFVIMLDVIQQYCLLRAINFLRLDGATHRDQRQRDINEFNNPTSPYSVFLISTHAGGLGINLTGADTVILFDSDWNPHLDIQALFRALRVGQRALVRIYRLYAKDCVDQRIVESARKKLTLSHLVVTPVRDRAAERAAVSSKKEQYNVIENSLMFGAQKILEAADSLPSSFTEFSKEAAGAPETQGGEPVAPSRAAAAASAGDITYTEAQIEKLVSILPGENVRLSSLPEALIEGNTDKAPEVKEGERLLNAEDFFKGFRNPMFEKEEPHSPGTPEPSDTSAASSPVPIAPSAEQKGAAVDFSAHISSKDRSAFWRRLLGDQSTKEIMKERQRAAEGLKLPSGRVLRPRKNRRITDDITEYTESSDFEPPQEPSEEEKDEAFIPLTPKKPPHAPPVAPAPKPVAQEPKKSFASNDAPSPNPVIASAPRARLDRSHVFMYALPAGNDDYMNLFTQFFAVETGVDMISPLLADFVSRPNLAPNRIHFSDITYKQRAALFIPLFNVGLPTHERLWINSLHNTLNFRMTHPELAQATFYANSRAFGDASSLLKASQNIATFCRFARLSLSHVRKASAGELEDTDLPLKVDPFFDDVADVAAPMLVSTGIHDTVLHFAMRLFGPSFLPALAPVVYKPLLDLHCARMVLRWSSQILRRSNESFARTENHDSFDARSWPATLFEAGVGRAPFDQEVLFALPKVGRRIYSENHSAPRELESWTARMDVRLLVGLCRYGSHRVATKLIMLDNSLGVQPAIAPLVSHLSSQFERSEATEVFLNQRIEGLLSVIWHFCEKQRKNAGGK